MSSKTSSSLHGATMSLSTVESRGKGRRRPQQVIRSFADLLVVPVVLVLIWWLVAVLVDSAVFPDPLQAVQGLLVDLTRSSYRESIAITLTLLAIGWVAAVVVGGLVGFLLGLSPFWARVFSTPLSAVYSIPLVTLYPVFLVFLGIGMETRVVFAFFHSVFPMALLVLVATASINKNYLKLADVLVLPFHVKLYKILIPAILPALATALRIAFGLTLLGLLIAGMVSATDGLGHELVLNISSVRMDRISGQLILVIVIAVVPGLLLKWFEVSIARRFGGAS